MHTIPSIHGATLLDRIQHIPTALNANQVWFETPRTHHLQFSDKRTARISNHSGARHENYIFSSGQFGVAIHASDRMDTETQAAFLVASLYLFQPGVDPLKVAEITYFTDLERGTFRAICYSNSGNDFTSIAELRHVTAHVIEFADAVVRAIE